LFLPLARACRSLMRCAAPAQLVLGLEKGVVPKEPVSLDTLYAFITYLTSAGESFPTEGQLKDVTGDHLLTGRGAGAPSVLKHLWAVGSFESALNLRSNVYTYNLRARCKRLRKSWRVIGAVSYDVVEVRPLLRRCSATQPWAARHAPRQLLRVSGALRCWALRLRCRRRAHVLRRHD
jgi:hypothetical protein